MVGPDSPKTSASGEEGKIFLNLVGKVNAAALAGRNPGQVLDTALWLVAIYRAQ